MIKYLSLAALTIFVWLLAPKAVACDAVKDNPNNSSKGGEASTSRPYDSVTGSHTGLGNGMNGSESSGSRPNDSVTGSATGSGVIPRLPDGTMGNSAGNGIPVGMTGDGSTVRHPDVSSTSAGLQPATVTRAQRRHHHRSRQSQFESYMSGNANQLQSQSLRPTAFQDVGSYVMPTTIRSQSLAVTGSGAAR